MDETFSSLGIKIHHRSIPDFRGFIRPVVDCFVTVLQNNFPEEVVEQFYQNVDSLKLKKSNHMSASVAAFFNSSKNEIIYGEDELDGDESFSIFHELFHMTSCKGKNNVGFHSGKRKCGVGINEGYTELLTRKYFGFQKNDYNYFVEISTASVLTSIIEEKRMTELYMSADIDGLITELGHYLGEEGAEQFIKNLDLYTVYTAYKPFLLKIPFVQKKVENLVHFISQSLAFIYLQKNMGIIQNIDCNDVDSIREFYRHYREILHTWNTPGSWDSSGLCSFPYFIRPVYLCHHLTKMGYHFYGSTDISKKTL